MSLGVMMTVAYASDADHQFDGDAAGDFRSGRFASPIMVRLSGLPPSMALIPLAKCVYGNWVSGPADFTAGYTPDDLNRELRSLYEDLVPMFERGDPDALFAELNSNADKYGIRSPRDVYNGFFGDSAIAVDMSEDGTFVITNGAHRVWAARRLGITHLPARVSYL